MARTPYQTDVGRITTIYKANFTLKLKKRKFFAGTIDVFGRVICPGRFELVQHILDAVAKILLPTTQTRLRSFLGFFKVFRSFELNVARPATPLNKKLTNGQPKKCGHLD